MELEAHPLADLFPMMEGQAFADLVADIQEHGLREPIVLLDNQIIDGRNRFRACNEAGIEPRFDQYNGDDPASFVISLNLMRRHLSESQRAMVAGKLANFHHGGDRRSDQRANLPLEKTNAQAAEMLNVSERSVRTARQIQQKGTPELRQAVEAGEVSVSAAGIIADQPGEVQQEIISPKDQKKLAAAVRELRDAQQFAKEVAALPKRNPLTVQEKADRTALFGTPELRGLVMDIIGITETISTMPTPGEMVDIVPPALHHTLEAQDLLDVSEWFGAFAQAWQAKEKVNVTPQ